MDSAFDAFAASYDQWYDSAEGGAVFEAEVACLRQLCGQCRGRWLEVGVGTGRFAAALGIHEGVDPSPRMLEMAAQQGIRTYEGRAEALPFPPGSFDGVLLALTLCFVGDAEAALTEVHRVLRSGGRLLIGAIPADSPWGRLYEGKAAGGHPLYAQATFRTAAKTVALVEGAGFQLLGAASTLLWEPGAAPPEEPLVKAGLVPEAGFASLLFAKGRRAALPASHPPESSE